MKVLALMFAGLLAVSCGGGESEPSSNGDPTGECTIGPVVGDDSFCADALIDELATVPLPDFADQLGPGNVYPSDGRAGQNVYFSQPVEDVVAFYEEALPAADFEITDAYGGEGIFTFEFLDPEGSDGSLLIRTVATHPSQMSIQIRVFD